MPRLAANLSLLYTEHAFLDRFAAAADDGFTGVEVQFPYAAEPDAIAAALARSGTQMVLHNLPPGDWAAGDRGLACLPGREAAFRAGVEQALTYALALGCPRLNCLAGVTPPDVPDEAVRRTLVGNLRHAAERCAAAGVALLVEPVNPFDNPGFHLTTVEAALDIMDETGSANLFLQYDFYHRARTGGDLLGTFRRHKARIAHVQLADAPGRHEPGTGALDARTLLDGLDQDGYEGWVGCEYVPLAGTSAGLGWAKPWLA